MRSSHRPATEWYLASFGFSCLHYLLYAAFVGFARERNPLAGRMKRSATWGEQRWDGTQVAVDGATLAGSIRSRSSSGGHVDRGNGASGGIRRDGDEWVPHGPGEEEGGPLASEDDDEGFSSEEDDEDDIVDVPRRYHGGGLTAASGATLRHRASQASLLSVAESVQSLGRQPTSPRSRAASGLGAVRNYGSINSLGKCEPAQTPRRYFTDSDAIQLASDAC